MMKVYNRNNQFNSKFKKMIILLNLFLSFCAFSAEDNMDKADDKTVNRKIKIQEAILGMNVSGNKEAPNLLYIIPWKDSTEHSKPPEVNRLMDEVFSTIDPDVYEKELGFYQQLTKTNSLKLEKK